MSKIVLGRVPADFVCICEWPPIFQKDNISIKLNIETMKLETIVNQLTEKDLPRITNETK